MDPTADESLLREWLGAGPGPRPPRDVWRALLNIAREDLALAVALNATQGRQGSRGPSRKGRPGPKATPDGRVAELAAEQRGFIADELAQAGDALVGEIVRALLEAALGARRAARDPGDARALDTLRRRCVGRLARGLFGAYFRIPFEKGRLDDPRWARFLSYAASDHLTEDALRFVRAEHPLRVLDAEARLENVGHPRDDLPQEFIAVVYREGAPPSYHGVASTIRFFVSKAAYAWVELIRDAMPGRPTDAPWDEVAGRPAREDPDFPDGWEAFRERLEPHAGDARRLLLLRLVRGPFPGPLNPAELGWQAVLALVEGLPGALPAQVERLLADAGADVQSVVASFDLSRALSPGADGLLLGAKAAIEDRVGCPHANWSVNLLASYYFLALIQPDRAFSPYPVSIDWLLARAAKDGLRDNAVWYWLVDFLRHGYHLASATRPAGRCQQDWELVARLLQPVDDLIAAHRFIRITRLPAHLCWQRLDRLAAGRALRPDALKQFHSRHTRAFGVVAER